MTIRADDAGAGIGLVKVEDAVVTEVGFVDGAVVSQASNFATLSTEQAVAVVHRHRLGCSHHHLGLYQRQV